MRVATPLVLAALGGHVLRARGRGRYRAGRARCWARPSRAAATAATELGSAWLGLVAGVLAAVTLALVHGYACITHNGNQVVSGMALNILVSGLTPVLGNAWFRQGGQTPQLTGDARFSGIELRVRQGGGRMCR